MAPSSPERMCKHINCLHDLTAISSSASQEKWYLPNMAPLTVAPPNMAPLTMAPPNMAPLTVAPPNMAPLTVPPNMALLTMALLTMAHRRDWRDLVVHRPRSKHQQ